MKTINSDEKMIGVIGGMGPMASQLFYRMVTEMTAATTDQDHVKMLILSDTQMPDRTKAILSGNTDDVTQRMLSDAILLQSAGCSAIAVTCNTAHYFVDIIQEKISIPFIHMINDTASYLGEICSGDKIAILATDGTIEIGAYQKALLKEGLEPYVLSDEGQRNVMYEIYDCIKSGNACDTTIWKKIEKEVLGTGCSKAIMGCTELSIIKKDESLGEMYVDPMEILARRVIEFTGHKVKEV